MFNLKTRSNHLKRFGSMCVVFGVATFTFSPTVDAIDAQSTIARGELDNVAIKSKQIVDINKNLKTVIEENQKLSDLTSRLQGEIDQLQGQRTDDYQKYSDLKKERDQLAAKLDQMSSTNRKYSQEVKQLETNIAQLQDANDENIRRTQMLKTEIVAQPESVYETEEVLLASADMSDGDETVSEVVSREEQTIDLLTNIDVFAENDEGMRLDAGRAHYNMGNIYFHKGEYQIAAQEYYQAVTLMPDDPDAHFNLALVSGDFLNDHQTAVKHYNMYLYLRPNADDIPMVKEKLLHSQLVLDGKVNSILECGKDKKTPCR